MTKKISLAKIILIILITSTSIISAILISFNWNDYFNQENNSLGEDKAMGNYFFQQGIVGLIIDFIWVGLFFILDKKTKKLI